MTPSAEKELLDRTRRIETRFTKYLEERGFVTNTKKPYFSEGIVTIHSRATSIDDCIKTIPPDWPADKEVLIKISNQYVASIYLQQEEPHEG